MKDSGVQWIGKIPESWGLWPIKYLASIVQGATPDTSDARYWDEDSADVKWVTPADMAWDGQLLDTAKHITRLGCNSCAATLLPRGTVVVSSRAPIGKVGYMTESMCTNQGCKSLVPRLISGSFLYWALIAGREELASAGRGTTFMELSSSGLGRIVVPTPDRLEQERIACELYDRTTEIDSAVVKLEQQISILERYKASLIHEAVTKGLDPSAPTKPSGVEWAEAIPLGWRVTPFKYVARVAPNLVDPNGYPDLIEIDPDNIESNSGRLVNVVTADEVGAISAKQLFRRGQLLYSKIRPALNKVAIAPSDGLCSADMYPLETKECTRWLLYAMRSPMFVAQTSLVANRVAMPKINVNELGRIKLIVPPLSEQQAIADYLDKRCGKIDAILDIKHKQIDVLKRRRQSLIYEYVTGKRRVSQEA